MRELFEPGTENVFQLFSSAHLLTLAVFLLMTIMIFLFRKPLRNPRANRIARFGLFSVLVISEISLQVWLWWSGHWSYQYSLPLHLSSISLILSAILLLTRKYGLFEFTYFVGVGRALQAIRTALADQDPGLDERPDALLEEERIAIGQLDQTTRNRTKARIVPEERLQQLVGVLRG